MNDLAHPMLLVLLAAVPGLVYLRYRPGRHPSLRFSDAASLERLPVSLWMRLRFLLPALFGLGLTLVVVALAGPRRGLDESVVRTEALDIILLVDVSPSMKAVDFATPTKRINRLASAKQVIKTFIDGRPDDRIGLVAFSTLPYSVSPLTLDHDWLQYRVDLLEAGMLGDNTAIGSALVSAVNRLRESKAESKIIILLTDGENNAGTVTPIDAARAAQAMDVKVYTVGAGTDGDVPVETQDAFGRTRYVSMFSRIDETTLKEIASVTNARYFRATNLRALGDVYEEIDRLEKTEIEVEHYTQYELLMTPFLAAGLVLLGLEKLLALTRMGRLPS